MGATAVPVPLVEGRHDLDAMAAALSERTKAVIICNPNNPTGAAIALPELMDFIERIDPTVLVLVDEAYIDFADDSYSSIVGSLKRFPNVVVGRTFSKAYALAG
ncbi:aminotransferase class I/II-fold pyridoxal phosphate-dependent enzyme, partial [Aerococcus sp. UMB8623]|uniref:aminotransferase class I/II-fold pyridoxal phosphate-dependent enzyme n=1 Tax=Aerococcus sp. UMB8623 TaxID=3046348 RepID=UPI00254F5765